MNILITGGSGMIGRAFSRIMNEAGHEVRLLSRNPNHIVLSGSVQVHAWDGRTADGWVHLAEEADAIVNLAGENLSTRRWSPAQKRRILSSRLQAGEAIITAIQNASRRPQVVMQASAIGYYGPLDDRMVDEVSPAGNDFLSGVCVDWENTTAGVAELGVRHVVIRTGLVLDAQNGALARLLPAFRLFAGGPIGGGNQYWSWIHLMDQVRAMRFLLEKPDAQGIYNLTAPGPLPMADFGRELGRTLHRPYWLPIPALLLEIILGEMSTILLTGQRVIPKRLLEAGFEFYYPNLQKAFDALLSPII
jgi:uncharacterized protein (TIGR01777 family)